jgi:hypothetical protein
MLISRYDPWCLCAYAERRDQATVFGAEHHVVRFLEASC